MGVNAQGAPVFTIGGDPGGIRTRAQVMADRASEFADVYSGLTSLKSDGWKGRAADRFREKFKVQTQGWMDAQTAFSSASAAYLSYATTLENAQNQLPGIRSRWEQGRAAVEAAQANQDSVRNQAASAGVPAVFDSSCDEGPGEDAMAAAQTDFNTLVATVNDAGNQLISALNAGIAMLPERTWWDATCRTVGSVLVGFVEAVADLLKLACKLGGFDTVFDFGRMLMGDMSWDEYMAKHAYLPTETVTGLAKALWQDPIGFMKGLGKAVLDWDAWADDPGRAIGHLLPDVIIAVATAGTGTGASAGEKAASGAARAARIGREVFKAILPVNPDDIRAVSKLGKNLVEKLSNRGINTTGSVAQLCNEAKKMTSALNIDHAAVGTNKFAGASNLAGDASHAGRGADNLAGAYNLAGDASHAGRGTNNLASASNLVGDTTHGSSNLSGASNLTGDAAHAGRGTNGFNGSANLVGDVAHAGRGTSGSSGVADTATMAEASRGSHANGYAHAQVGGGSYGGDTGVHGASSTHAQGAHHHPDGGMPARDVHAGSRSDSAAGYSDSHPTASRDIQGGSRGASHDPSQGGSRGASRDVSSSGGHGNQPQNSHAAQGGDASGAERGSSSNGSSSSQGHHGSGQGTQGGPQPTNPTAPKHPTGGDAAAPQSSQAAVSGETPRGSEAATPSQASPKPAAKTHAPDTDAPHAKGDTSKPAPQAESSKPAPDTDRAHAKTREPRSAHPTQDSPTKTREPAGKGEVNETPATADKPTTEHHAGNKPGSHAGEKRSGHAADTDNKNANNSAHKQEPETKPREKAEDPADTKTHGDKDETSTPPAKDNTHDARSEADSRPTKSSEPEPAEKGEVNETPATADKPTDKTPAESTTADRTDKHPSTGQANDAADAKQHADKDEKTKPTTKDNTHEASPEADSKRADDSAHKQEPAPNSEANPGEQAHEDAAKSNNDTKQTKHDDPTADKHAPNQKGEDPADTKTHGDKDEADKQASEDGTLDKKDADATRHDGDTHAEDHGSDPDKDSSHPKDTNDKSNHPNDGDTSQPDGKDHPKTKETQKDNSENRAADTDKSKHSKEENTPKRDEDADQQKGTDSTADKHGGKEEADTPHNENADSTYRDDDDHLEESSGKDSKDEHTDSSDAFHSSSMDDQSDLFPDDYPAHTFKDEDDPEIGSHESDFVKAHPESKEPPTTVEELAERSPTRPYTPDRDDLPHASDGLGDNYKTGRDITLDPQGQLKNGSHPDMESTADWATSRYARENGVPNWREGINHGAVPETDRYYTDLQELVEDFHITGLDRTGNTAGGFLAPVVDDVIMPAEYRSTPPSNINERYHQYRFTDAALPDGWRAEISIAAPDHGSLGGSPQIRILEQDITGEWTEVRVEKLLSTESPILKGVSDHVGTVQRPNFHNLHELFNSSRGTRR